VIKWRRVKRMECETPMEEMKY